jgi:hypothetical protein
MPPLKKGWSDATLTANISALMREGSSRNAAIFIAACEARASWFSAHTKGFLPARLAFPKSARARSNYDRDGRPTKAAFERDTATISTNPRPHSTASAIGRAAKLYTGFTGKAPKTLKRLSVPDAPKAALAIGKVFGIMYSVDATAERFHHEFKGKARPTLIVANDGKQVFLRGGAYTFTQRGFVDKT